MSTTATTSTKVISPFKLAHIVLQTNKYEHMKRFYVSFLGGHIVKDTGFMSFVTYDDEHHRIALINAPDIKDKDLGSSGLAHVAFTFDSLKDLCASYRQRKALGIEPGWCVNHGPTTSMYYRDPDSNVLEVQVDNCGPDEATAMMTGPEFERNNLGTDFDPEELCAAVERGEDEESLKVQKESGPRDGEKEFPGLMAKVLAAPVGI